MKERDSSLAEADAWSDLAAQVVTISISREIVGPMDMQLMLICGLLCFPGPFSPSPLIPGPQCHAILREHEGLLARVAPRMVAFRIFLGENLEQPGGETTPS